MDDMTNERLAEIRERAEAATPGPWTAPGGAVVRAPHHPGISGSLSDAVCTAFTPNRDNHDASVNTEFIAHAREDVPALLDEVERLRAKYQDALNDYGTAITVIAERERENSRLRAELEAAKADIRDLLADGKTGFVCDYCKQRENDSCECECSRDADWRGIQPAEPIGGGDDD